MPYRIWSKRDSHVMIIAQPKLLHLYTETWRVLKCFQACDYYVIYGKLKKFHKASLNTGK